MSEPHRVGEPRSFDLGRFVGVLVLAAMLGTVFWGGLVYAHRALLTFELRHGGTAVHADGTVEWSEGSCDETCSFDNYVSYTVGGTRYGDVDMPDTKRRASGAVVPLLVNARKPSEVIRADDHGYKDLVLAGIALPLPTFLGYLVVGELLVRGRDRLRRARNAAPPTQTLRRR